jgi:hypothetical protein
MDVRRQQVADGLHARTDGFTSAEHTLRATPGVLDTGQVRMRWIGHQIRAECEVIVDPAIIAVQAHQVTVAVEHALRTAARSGADAHFDWDDPETYAPALHGIKRVYLLGPGHADGLR